MEVISGLVREGFLNDVAQWVVTNLRKTNPSDSSSSAYSWTFDLDGIAQMYQSYEETNLWCYKHEFLKDQDYYFNTKQNLMLSLQSFSAFRQWGDSEQRSLARRLWFIAQRVEGFYKAAFFDNLLVFLYTGSNGWKL
ncbi:hypothetical protein Lser_V15G28748 [Lactuca serriola]